MANSSAAPLPDSTHPKFTFVTKALDTTSEDGHKRFSAIASSTITDRAGDEITLRAMEQMAGKFRDGLTIFVDHNKSAYNAFGTTDRAEIREGGVDKDGARVWDLHIGGVVNEPSPRAMELYQSIDGGFVKFGTSIGAFVLDHERKKGGGLRIDDIDVFEASIVGVPMNQRSWAYKAAKAVKSFYPDMDEETPAMDQTTTITTDSITVSTGGNKVFEPVEFEVGEADPETIVIKADGCTCAHEGDCGEDCSCGSHKSIEAAIADPETPTIEATLDVPETSDEVTPETTSTDGQEAPAATPETASGPLDKAFASSDVVELVSHVQKLATLLSEKTVKISELQAENDRLVEENAEAKKALERIVRMPLRRKAAGEYESLTQRMPDFLDPRITEYLSKVAGE